jgi:hypothetical protein
MTRCSASSFPLLITTASEQEARFWVINFGFRVIARLESCRYGKTQFRWHLVRPESTTLPHNPSLLNPGGNHRFLVGVPKVMMYLVPKPFRINAAVDAHGVDAPAQVKQVLKVVALIMVQANGFGELDGLSGGGHKAAETTALRVVAQPQPEGAN